MRHESWCCLAVARISLSFGCATTLFVGTLWHESYCWYSASVARILLASHPRALPSHSRFRPPLSHEMAGLRSKSLLAHSWGHRSTEKRCASLPRTVMCESLLESALETQQRSRCLLEGLQICAIKNLTECFKHRSIFVLIRRSIRLAMDL